MRLRFPVILLLAMTLALASACAERRPTAGSPTGEAADRRWSEGRLPKYAPQPVTASGPAVVGDAPIRIGVLLPLSGPYAAYGRTLLDAATLAVFDLDVRRTVEILPRDTGGDPNAAGAAAIAALADGATALIGPARTASAANVIRAATAKGAPVLMLTGERRLAEPGVFAAGHAVEAAATRVVDFAYRRGVRSLAALAPQGDDSAAAMNGLQAAADARGMRIVQAGYLTSRARMDDIRRILAAALASLGPDGALFLPFPAEDLAPFAAALQELAPGAPPMLLGVSNWESAGLASLPGFAGAVYAGPDPALSAAFRQRFAATFGHAPSRDGPLVYDLVATLALAGQGASAGGIGVHDLVTEAGFSGVEGPFRLRLGGGVQRGYAIVGVRQGRLTVIEPAPARFDAGF